MEIRDPVHGSIHILDEEIPIIKHPFFQRLRSIKQLGFSEYVFPGATHTRFLHSIGVMHVGTRAFNALFPHYQSPELLKIKETFKLACLLHDVGHAPLSHSTEIVMPMLSQLKIPKDFLHDSAIDRQANHEDYTIKSIADSSFSRSFKLVEEKFGVKRNRIADLVIGSCQDKSYFTVDGICYFPILHQLVSSEMDCDRMDYLLRDSYFCGVSYGQFDLDWLLDNLQACFVQDQAFLGISERSVVTFDDFLLSRYHMFIMVYFHYRSVCLEQLLYKFFKTAPLEYTIPANIEEYLDHDDHFLMKVLKKSKNEYAQNLIQNKIPQKIFESFNPSQLVILEKIESYLKKNNIDFIKCSSPSRLSKYYPLDGSENYYSLKVVRKVLNAKEAIYSDINKATDLFQKFSISHAVDRLHCNINDLEKSQQSDILKLIQN